jgi:hypothetical protein
MFFRYLDPIFAPFRAVKNKVMGVRNIKGNIHADFNRVKSMGNNAKSNVQRANEKMNSWGGQGQQAQQQMPGQQQPQQPGYPPQQAYQQGAQQMQMPGMPPGGGFPPGMPGAPQMPPGMPGMPAPGQPNANPAIRSTGFWVFKKKFCTQCEQQLDKSWDACPFCAQIAQQAAAAPAKLQKMKTQALVIDPSGQVGVQLLGWLIPLQGPHKGELYTLSPHTMIGNGPESTIVMQDKFMSGKHAEIKAENGMWILRDVGSTNGTYVNNRRVDRHELVDNDFIKFGSAMCKFKAL